jgi:hypothetical protein
VEEDELLQKVFSSFLLDPDYMPKQAAVEFYLRYGGYPALTGESLSDAGNGFIPMSGPFWNGTCGIWGRFRILSHLYFDDTIYHASCGVFLVLKDPYG